MGIYDPCKANFVTESHGDEMPVAMYNFECCIILAKFKVNAHFQSVWGGNQSLRLRLSIKTDTIMNMNSARKLRYPVSNSRLNKKEPGRDNDDSS